MADEMEVDEALKLCDAQGANENNVPSSARTLAAEVRRLRRENAHLRETMVAAAEEISEHWDAHCDKEGYGPSSLLHRLEQGIASSYPGYAAGQFQELLNELAWWKRRFDCPFCDAQYGVQLTLVPTPAPSTSSIGTPLIPTLTCLSCKHAWTDKESESIREAVANKARQEGKIP